MKGNTPIGSIHASQSGYSLIEVLIAALILSIAILGIAGMQVIGMKGTHQSFMKQQATGVVQNMIERMRANYAGVVAGNYVVNSAALNCATPKPNCATTDCNPAQIALSDKLNIVCGYQNGSSARTGGVKTISATDNAILTNGVLNIRCRNCAVGDVTIAVGWTERAFGKEATTPDSLTIDTRISAP